MDALKKTIKAAGTNLEPEIKIYHLEEDLIDIRVNPRLDEHLTHAAIVSLAIKNSFQASLEKLDLPRHIREALWNKDSAYAFKGYDQRAKIIEFNNLNWMAVISGMAITKSLRHLALDGTWYREMLEPYLQSCGVEIVAVLGDNTSERVEGQAPWKKLGFSPPFIISNQFSPRTAPQEYLTVKRLSSSPVEAWKSRKEIKGLLVHVNTGRIKFSGKNKPLINLKCEELIVVRHGETQANRENRYQGNVDKAINQLTLKGRQQARQAAIKLFDMVKNEIEAKNIIVITSQLGRAKEAAKAFIDFLKKRNLSVEVAESALLNELSFGIWENKRRDELDAIQSGLCARFREGLDAVCASWGAGGATAAKLLPNPHGL